MNNVLILCTGNTARSIIAEALVNHELGDQWRAFSAGVLPSQVNPYARRVLAEIGISTDDARSKSVAEFLARDDLDLVITVCDHARETCPASLNPVEQVHIGIEDPSPLPGEPEPEHVTLAKFRAARSRIRDELVGYLRGRS
ncbi:MAG: Arsenate reductase [Calditrichaeota bacterium]|nr:Arsenate reductase [Calditrichota bacterium]